MSQMGPETKGISSSPKVAEVSGAAGLEPTRLNTRLLTIGGSTCPRVSGLRNSRRETHVPGSLERIANVYYGASGHALKR